MVNNASGANTAACEPVIIVDGMLSKEKVKILRNRTFLNLKTLCDSFTEDDLRCIVLLNRMGCGGAAGKES
jgi:hypothetical protein